MEILFVIALLWGAGKAVERGVQHAGKRAKAAAAKYAKAHPSKPGRAGRTLGHHAGATAHGALGLARGFGAGVRAGWPEGRQAARDWHDRRRSRADSRSQSRPDSRSPVSPDSLGEPLAPIPVGDPPADPSERTPAAPKPAADEPRTDLRDYDTPADDGGATPTPEDRDMPETAPYGWTSTGTPNPADRPVSGGSRGDGQGDQSGEITNYAQLVQRLQQIEQTATDDLEDAKADADRAETDLREVEGMVASLQQMKLDQGTVGEVAQLADSGRARAEAAKARQAAAEQRAAQAAQARQTVEQNYRQWYEASQAAPAVPEREFANA